MLLLLLKDSHSVPYQLTRRVLSRVHTPPRPNRTLMTPPLNSINLDFYLDLHQTAPHFCLEDPLSIL